MELQFSFGSSRGKKVWIKGYQEVKHFEECLDEEIVNRLCSIELNPIDNDNKLVWLLESKKQGFTTKDEYIELPKERQDYLVSLAYSFAETNGYLDRIFKKYKQ